MVVSMIQVRLELPAIESIKDKRRIVVSLKDQLHKKYRVSVAEVDLQDSLRFAQIGAAYVSNSKRLGETVMQKTLAFVESHFDGRVMDAEIFSESY
jgi:uncharacterized protein YlxP (DUF503 family)